jgi:hypothetical protein
MADATDFNRSSVLHPPHPHYALQQIIIITAVIDLQGSRGAPAFVDQRLINL